MRTVYPDPSPVLKKIEVVDLGKEGEEMAEPIQEEPVAVEADLAETRATSEELLVPSHHPEETTVEAEEGIESDEGEPEEHP